jgi:LytS/YehU family sensor histidine kinase
LIFYTFFFGYERVDYKITFSFVVILLPVTIITTYYLNYILIPKYIFSKRYAKFFLYFIYTLIISFYIEMGTVLVIFIGVAELKITELYPSNTNAILLIAGMYVVVFLGVALKLLNHYNHSQVEIEKLKSEKVEAELKFLKSQLHPHFLFNTLNNLYALTLEKSDRASDVVLKLSELLDYILYKCNAEMVTMEQEIKQIENYIELEKLRFGGRLELTFNIGQFPITAMIPPMLLMTLVENSFKHGVSKTVLNSWIHIDLFPEGNQLIFNIKNSKQEPVDIKTDSSGGVGLQNLQNRLNLIYKDNYTFTIDEQDTFFNAQLIIKTKAES